MASLVILISKGRSTNLTIHHHSYAKLQVLGLQLHRAALTMVLDVAHKANFLGAHWAVEAFAGLGSILLGPFVRSHLQFWFEFKPAEQGHSVRP